MFTEQTLIVLIAPNVSEQKGGEAMKALQIFNSIRAAHPNILQITHERNECELSQRTDLGEIVYVRDTAVSLLLWRSRVLRFFLDFWFSRKAVAMADEIATARQMAAVIHQTEPNSPVSSRALSRKYPNVLGPINGNIYYPQAFRHYETLHARLRRLFHMPSQFLNAVFARSMTRVDLILCAGGERTRRSLLARGCRPAQLLDSLDCGVPEQLLNRPRIRHKGRNTRFVHFGRLVLHKCTFLIIECLPHTRENVSLDIVGDGPELESCKTLVTRLGLEERVRFLGWYQNHRELLDSLGAYRGVVFPSIEDANGIVVQEAMAVGLPPVCLDWGGPQLLVEHGVSGYLIRPSSRDQIIKSMAQYLDRLAADGATAEAMSIAARSRAESWRWRHLVNAWLRAYDARFGPKLVLQAAA
jgi:glycosyltransferase involved in cell wall biosynthesis